MENKYEEKLKILTQGTSIFKDTSNLLVAILGVIGTIITIYVWFTALKFKEKLFFTIIFIVILLICLVVKFILKMNEYKKIAISSLEDLNSMDQKNNNLVDELKITNEKIHVLESNKTILLNSNDRYKKKAAAYKRGFITIVGCIEDNYIKFPNNDIAKTLKVSANEANRKILLELEE